MVAFLSTLPGVGPKTAYCVLVCALRRVAFPVDTHNLCVLARFGMFHEAGVDHMRFDHKRGQAGLADLIAPELRHSLHISLILHGRDVCQPQPCYGECELSNLCSSHRSIRLAEPGDSGRLV